MNRVYCYFFATIWLIGSSLAVASEHGGMNHSGALCGDRANPLLSVADFNGDGVVDNNDIVILSKHVGGKGYYALYDRNSDGDLTGADVALATKDIGMLSTVPDREIAKIYNRFKYLQAVQGNDNLSSLGYFPIPPALKGHGTHWFNSSGLASLLGQKEPSIYTAEGLNVSSDKQVVHAVFWASPAVLVFENGATDYPNGENWKDSQVIRFDNTPAALTSSVHESWHKHAGLCLTTEHSYDGNGNVVRTGNANQHTTYNECQAISNDEPQPDGSNMWASFWMVHMWLYDLNPNGFFAGQHPCVDPDELDETTINADRNVPLFFQH